MIYGTTALPFAESCLIESFLNNAFNLLLEVFCNYLHTLKCDNLYSGEISVQVYAQIALNLHKGVFHRVSLHKNAVQLTQWITLTSSLT